MYISVFFKKRDDAANYFISAAGNLRIIRVCDDIAVFQFHCCALAVSKCNLHFVVGSK